MIESVIDGLLRSQNTDGGWGATQNRRSNTEATSFTLLGLSMWSEAVPAARLTHGLTWLTTRQHAAGSWPLTEQLPAGSWATALAILALDFCALHRQQALRGAHWLLRQEGRRLGWYTSLLYRFLPHTLPIQMNPDLQGWSWTANTFSWVEPTAYALIALKKLWPFLPQTQAKARIRQGERLLYDRMCAGGGWNYGNTQVFDEPLPPYPETTALSLIALQEYQAAEPNQRSLHALRQMLGQAGSGLGLSLATLCFSLYGHDVSAWRTLLARHYEQTGFLGETKTLALALLALGDGSRVFRITAHA
jgi:hypothetical protein